MYMEIYVGLLTTGFPFDKVLIKWQIRRSAMDMLTVKMNANEAYEFVD